MKNPSTNILSSSSQTIAVTYETTFVMTSIQLGSSSMNLIDTSVAMTNQYLQDTGIVDAALTATTN